MTTPIELLSNLVIGAVESVSPSEVRVQLDLDAPHSTALNTGSPVSFPRINSYVLIPNESGATVAYVAWIGIERSPYPKRSGLKDFGLVDLPFPIRKMAVSPVGTLTCVRSGDSQSPHYELERGVVAFPSVGDQVLIATPEQIAAIVGAKESDRRIRIGTSPLAANASIMVDPDKLFGRHLAVLGNTGSGKSCTVAGLIRWSLEASTKAIRSKGSEDDPNTRFIVLDPNGEYASAFSDFGSKLRLFRVPPVSSGEQPLDVPAWLWSGHEWSAVAHAQPGAQRPLLLQGIRELKSGRPEKAERGAVIARYLYSYLCKLNVMLGAGSSSFSGEARARFSCAELLANISVEARVFASEVGLETHHSEKIAAINSRCDEVLASRGYEYNEKTYYRDFLVADLESVKQCMQDAIEALPESDVGVGASEDSPDFFDIRLLPDHLERIATEQGGQVVAFLSTLRLRLRGMIADRQLGSVIGKEPPTTFEKWLHDYIGGNEASNGPLAVIDLSLVPSEVIHVVVAVLSRLVFEALQRYRRENEKGLPLPTVLVLEEAHTFIRKTKEDEGAIISAQQLCRESFERIAREGRKFGLGLVLSSQRPFELSPTVLAQCNTFLLHRIVNDSDQTLVAKLVPDNVAGLLAELPSLPSRQAILLGWATPIPVLVDIDELLKEHRPNSSDPDFWKVWTKESDRKVDWDEIAKQWRRQPPNAESTDSSSD